MKVVLKKLVWDEWNSAHIARHNVAPEEVEEAVCQDAVVLTGKKGRVHLIAPTRKNRLIAVILDPEPDEDGIYYPVTARDASRKERRYYAQEEGEKAA